MEHFELMSVSAVLHICKILPCQRLVPLLFTKVLRNKYRMALGRLDILCNEEHIDVIDRFIQASVISSIYRDKASIYIYNVLQEVCE